MMRGKPARKKNFFILGAAVVLCVVGLVMFFLISNLYKNNLCDNIASECPFTIAEDTDWKMYPNKNLAGLIALRGSLLRVGRLIGNVHSAFAFSERSNEFHFLVVCSPFFL